MKMNNFILKFSKTQVVSACDWICNQLAHSCHSFKHVTKQKEKVVKLQRLFYHASKEKLSKLVNLCQLIEVWDCSYICQTEKG